MRTMSDGWPTSKAGIAPLPSKVRASGQCVRRVAHLCLAVGHEWSRTIPTPPPQPTLYPSDAPESPADTAHHRSAATIQPAPVA
jgi:hypothetical protein